LVIEHFPVSWWRAGASWTGKDDAPFASVSLKKQEEELPSEQQLLLELAQRCRMNTAARRNIFCVLMSSGDVEDAFERLSRLNLQGKEDREIVRVLIECCGQEKLFNHFYAELAKLLCEQNRQFKTTFLFAFWDNFKLLSEGVMASKRRVANLARLLVQLVFSFHLPLSVIKPIDLSELNDGTVHFLSVFFTSLFTEKVKI
jgi:nucleolar MIF4G domain-containing protein 1